jgi:hypothetical protein
MTTTEIVPTYRLSYGGPGHGWYVVEQTQNRDNVWPLNFERVVSGPHTSVGSALHAQSVIASRQATS